jgi:hypothetical protein
MIIYIYEQKTACLECEIDNYKIEIILPDDGTDNIITIKKFKLCVIPKCLTSRCHCIDFSYFRFICNEMDDDNDQGPGIIGTSDCYIARTGISTSIFIRAFGLTNTDTNTVLGNDPLYPDSNLQAILCNGSFNGS